MSGRKRGAARAAPGYATHLHLDSGLNASKSAEPKVETKARVMILARLVSES